MGKSKKTSHREREAALNKFRTDAAVTTAYNTGHHDGFVNCLTIMMYSIMECTNYRQNGLMKIWNKTLDITEALTMHDITGLTAEDIMLALAAEGGIVADALGIQEARKALEKTGGKPNPDYKKVVDEAMARYAEAVEVRRAAEMGEN